MQKIQEIHQILEEELKLSDIKRDNMQEIQEIRKILEEEFCVFANFLNRCQKCLQNNGSQCQ